MAKTAKTNEKSAGIICLRGKLTDEGTECQAFRDTAGTLYTLVGDLKGHVNGDEVVVCGTPVEQSFCNQGITLAINDITLPHGHKDTKIRQRDVEAKVTRSSADNSPLFTLEGKDLTLVALGDFWQGKYSNVTIEGPLQIVFHSEGWKNQAFDLEVTVKHPTQPGKDKKETFRRVTSKGEVTFQEEMELA